MAVTSARGAVVTDTVVKPLRLSWSRIRNHTECPQKGALLSAGKKSPAADIRNFFLGTVVDRCMRDWLSSDTPEPGGMVAMVDELLDKSEKEARETGDGIVKWRHPRDKEESRAWCRELVTRLEPALQRYVLPFAWEPALWFSVPLSIPYLDGSLREIFLIGEMDILVRDGAGKHVVWDLKGTSDDSYWRKVVGQLVFYDIAVALMFGDWTVFSGLIQPMCKEQTLRWSFTEDQRREMFTRIVAVATDIWRGDLALAPTTSGCDRCPVKHACSRFQAPAGRGRAPLAR